MNPVRERHGMHSNNHNPSALRPVQLRILSTLRPSWIPMNKNAFKLGLFVLIASLTSCDVCEVKGTVTFDNLERLWCNCEVTWQNGDVYVIDAGEVRTYEFFRGNQSFDAYCGNDAFGNSLCGLEEGVRTRSYDIDCGDEHVMNLNF